MIPSTRVVKFVDAEGDVVLSGEVADYDVDSYIDDVISTIPVSVEAQIFLPNGTLVAKVSKPELSGVEL